MHHLILIFLKYLLVRFSLLLHSPIFIAPLVLKHFKSISSKHGVASRPFHLLELGMNGCCAGQSRLLKLIRNMPVLADGSGGR